MKRFISLIIILCLMSSLTIAEESDKSLWNSIGGWFDQAWSDTSGWVSQAWSDTTNWVEGAWGDASEWVEQAWNDSSQWVTDIWGDVSTWTSETFESTSTSIGIWLAERLTSVTEKASNPWEWLIVETKSLQPNALMTLSTIKEAVESNDNDAETIVKTAFVAMLKELKLNDEESQKVWDTIAAYAGQKGISQITASKLALPYLFQLTVENAEVQNDIPAIAIAQYLTAIIEKLGVKSTEEANQLIDQLNEALRGI